MHAAIRSAIEGGSYYSVGVMELNTVYDTPGSPEDGRPGLSTLTDREYEIALLVSRGLSVHEIAENLCVATDTVVSHKKRIFRKAGVHRAVELVRWMLTNGLVRIDEQW